MRASAGGRADTEKASVPAECSAILLVIILVKGVAGEHPYTPCCTAVPSNSEEKKQSLSLPKCCCAGELAIGYNDKSVFLCRVIFLRGASDTGRPANARFSFPYLSA